MGRLSWLVLGAVGPLLVTEIPGTKDHTASLKHKISPCCLKPLKFWVHL